MREKVVNKWLYKYHFYFEKGLQSYGVILFEFDYVKDEFSG